MTSRFRLPAGRTYNVRASELARDRQHTEVDCNILLLDNTVQAFKVNKHDQGQVLLDIVFKHLDLTERDYFGLQLADDSTDNPENHGCTNTRSSPTCMKDKPKERHTIKLLEVKDRIMKAAREKQIITIKGYSVRGSTDFSAETLQSKRHLDAMFKMLKEKKPVIQEFYTVTLFNHRHFVIKHVIRRFHHCVNIESAYTNLLYT